MVKPKIEMLTREQLLVHAVPLIRATMNDQLASSAEESYTDPATMKDRLAWGTFRRGQLIGLCGLCFNGVGTWVSYFAVALGSQRQGLGATMLAFLEAECGSRKIMRLFVETYSGPEFIKARNFYTKHRFEFWGFMKGEDGDVDTLYYRKEIKQIEGE